MTTKMVLLRATLVVLATGLLQGSSRGNAPAGRYSASGGAVRDTLTGLTWQEPASKWATWADAKAHCSGLGGGWRLPTCKELLTIYDTSQASIANPGAAIDSSAFPQTRSDDAYWSSTPTLGAPKAWSVNFSAATGKQMKADDTSAVHYVRCVK